MALALLRLLDPAADDDLQVSGGVIRRMIDAFKFRQGDAQRDRNQMRRRSSRKPPLVHAMSYQHERLVALPHPSFQEGPSSCPRWQLYEGINVA